MRSITIIFILTYLAAYTQKQGRLNLSENTFHFENHDYWIVDSTNGTYTVSRNGYLGLVNQQGQLIADAQFDVIEPFKYNATVATKLGKYGILNRAGKLIVPCEYETIKPFGCNITAFELNNRWGIINTKGEVLIPATYQQLSSFHNGMGVALNSNADYLLLDSVGHETFLFNRDQKGMSNSIKNEILDMVYRYSLNEYPGALYYYHDSIAKGVNLENFKYCFVDKHGNRLFDKDFEFTFPFEGKYAAVKTDEGWNYIDRNGNYQSSTWLPVLEMQGSVRIVEKKGVYGVIDTADNILIPFKYKSITALNDSLFAVLQENRWGNAPKWGVVDLKNKTILQCIYEGINFDRNTGIGKAGIYDHSVSLNTGVPRYTYFGHYFLFDHTGIIDKKEYAYSMLVEGISDWHKEGFSTSPRNFAPPLDVNKYGLTVNKHWGQSILGLGNHSNPSKITVTNCNGKEIISASGKPYVDIQVFPNCIIVRDNDHSIIYDHFGNRIFKTQNAILDGYDNGTFRMYTGNGNKEIDAHGNLIE